ncbi:MAG TPA: 50S ribosomal protein L24 [Pirellulaceae bacterium]|nr:50S ribosomal protein L24 [Pirellulaceae bacterium]
MRIKLNDIVVVIAGDDRGQRGKVLAIDNKAGKLIVEGVNKVYKHVKRSQKNPQGGRLSKEMPIQLANVLLYCQACAKPTRVGARFGADGSKERFCKKCSASLGKIAPAKAKYAKK